MQKQVDNLEFVQGVYFEFVESVKNKSAKYLIIFDDSLAEICNSKAFVDIGTAGRHREFSSIYTEHNLFHQRKVGRSFDLQNMRIVPYKVPRDVMQVSVISA